MQQYKKENEAAAAKVSVAPVARKIYTAPA
jgi:hypothetical protein